MYNELMMLCGIYASGPINFHFFPVIVTTGRRGSVPHFAQMKAVFRRLCSWKLKENNLILTHITVHYLHKLIHQRTHHQNISSTTHKLSSTSIKKYKHVPKKKREREYWIVNARCKNYHCNINYIFIEISK